MSREDRSNPYTYRDAGVDNASGSRAKERIGELIQNTFSESVVGAFGHFGGMYRAPGTDNQEILVSSADSVGTKVLVAMLAGRHESIGVDLVNHCINDVLCSGARPMFFLDYFATSNLDERVLNELVSGMSKACQAAGCALIGGETAQLPGIYQPGAYDLAGFVVGNVTSEKLIDGSAIEPGHRVVGIASNGLHTNGYSLARAVFGLDGDNSSEASMRLDRVEPSLGETLGEALLRPHPSYLPQISDLFETSQPAGLAHITGGGIAGNLSRIIPANCTAVLKRGAWKVPPILQLIQDSGGVDLDEMYGVFNMGVGMILVLDEASAGRFVERHDDAFLMGEIRASEPEDERVRLNDAASVA